MGNTYRHDLRVENVSCCNVPGVERNTPLICRARTINIGGNFDAYAVAYHGFGGVRILNGERKPRCTGFGGKERCHRTVISHIENRIEILGTRQTGKGK